MFMMAKRVVSRKNAKQLITTFFTIKAKYVKCYEATCEAIWLRNMIFKFNVYLQPLTIYCNNAVVVNFSENNKSLAY